MRLGDELVAGGEAEAKCTFFSSVSVNGVEYRLGDCAYFEPDAFNFDAKQPALPQSAKDNGCDEVNIYKCYM